MTRLLSDIQGLSLCMTGCSAWLDYRKQVLNSTSVMTEPAAKVRELYSKQIHTRVAHTCGEFDGPIAALDPEAHIADGKLTLDPASVRSARDRFDEVPHKS